ncbi:MAG: flavodoxin family protein [Spirochaetaceae bacterium]|nr:flavodoxin family protein [Spirochaetaceae bacterium]
MKILVIIGSLRKGNTYNIVKKIEAYHCQQYQCEYEYVFLKDINLQLCRGCFLCISQGEDLCPLKDERNNLITKIETADGVIVASPNYAQNVPWIMKNFIDRFAYTLHRPKFFNKKFMMLINSGSVMGAKSALKALSLTASGGAIINTAIVLTSPNMNEKKKERSEKVIKNTAISFAKNMNKKTSTKPSFGYLIWFSAFKAVSEVYVTEKADYEFYKSRNYFEDIPLNMFQTSTIQIFTRLFRFLLKMGIM